MHGKLERAELRVRRFRKRRNGKQLVRRQARIVNDFDVVEERGENGFKSSGPLAYVGEDADHL
jgi:hypothetical protein